MFPDSIFSPRTIANRPGVVYDANNIKTLFAEDVDGITDEIVAIENFLLGAPNGTLWNGKLVPSVASNNLTLALKTLAGNDPSTGDPVFFVINGVVHKITATLSITVNAGANSFNAGSSELATKEIDYFGYLGYNATDGVVIGFSRIPYANSYDDFSPTATSEKYCAISTITNALSTDYYAVVGRFAANLSAGAGYTWSVPTYTAKNLIQRPIYETRWLAWVITFTGFSSAPSSVVSIYKIRGDLIFIQIHNTSAGTSNATGFTMSAPFTNGQNDSAPINGVQPINNSAGLANPPMVIIIASQNSILCLKDHGANAWAVSGTKNIYYLSGNYRI